MRRVLIGLLACAFWLQPALAATSKSATEIASVYQTVLGRTASPEEIAYWESTGLTGNPLLNTIMSVAKGRDAEAVARYREAQAQKGIPKNPDPHVRELLEQAKKDGQAAREAAARGEDTMEYSRKYLPSPVATKTSSQTPTDPVANSGSVLWGAWIDGITTAPGATFQNIDAFNSMTGKKAAIEGFTAWWYVDADWGDFNNLYNNPKRPGGDWANEVTRRGAVPMIMWQPFDPSETHACESPGALERIKRFSPKNIAKGNFDPFIRNWARQVKAWGKPLHIRMMHELNYRRDIKSPCEYHTSWDAELIINGERINSPQDTVNAWKHIVDIFRSEGARNVKWVWSVLSYPSSGFGGTNPISLSSIYPGDSHVDWIGIECYNFKNEEWLSCRDRMEGIYREAAALSPKVPLMVAEMGAYESPQKAAWLTDALADSSSNAIPKIFPRITGIMYWNDSRYDGLWIKSSADSINAAKSALASTAYVAAGNAATSRLAGNLADTGAVSTASASAKRRASGSADIYSEITGEEPSAVESRLMATSFGAGVSSQDIRIEISNSADVQNRLKAIYKRAHGQAPSAAAIRAMSNHIARGGSVASVSEEIGLFAPGSNLVTQAEEKEQPIEIMMSNAPQADLAFGSVAEGSGTTKKEEGASFHRELASTEPAENSEREIDQKKAAIETKKETKAADSALDKKIKQLYREVLGREADSGGLDYWRKQLESGAMTYEQVKAAMQNSDEAKKSAGSTVRSAI